MRNFNDADSGYRLWYRCLVFCEVPRREWGSGVHEDFSGFREQTFEEWFAAKGEYLFGGPTPRYQFASKLDANAVRSHSISLWTYASYEFYRDTADLGQAMGEMWNMRPLVSRTGLVRRSARYQTQAQDLVRNVSYGVFPWHRNMRP